MSGSCSNPGVVSPETSPSESRSLAPGPSTQGAETGAKIETSVVDRDKEAGNPSAAHRVTTKGAGKTGGNRPKKRRSKTTPGKDKDATKGAKQVSGSAGVSSEGASGDAGAPNAKPKPDAAAAKAGPTADKTTTRKDIAAAAKKRFVGATLGPYEVVRHLASGGMAEVFVAKLKRAFGVEREVAR